MSLVYLVTGLPELERTAAPAVTRADFIARCRANLVGAERRELELLLLLEEVEAGLRIQAAAELDNADVSGDEVARLLSSREPATEGGTPIRELPSFLHRQRPLRVQLRRLWSVVYKRADSLFLREWAGFIVNLEETVTALLCKRQGLGRDAFLGQMRGSFDTTARYVIDHYEEPDAGIGQRFPWVPQVAAALDDPDFEAGERALNDIRWDMIERLRDPAPFSVDTVLAWYLQLRILEREAQWSAPAGQALLSGVLETSATILDTAILEQAVETQRAARAQEAA